MDAHNASSCHTKSHDEDCVVVSNLSSDNQVVNSDHLPTVEEPWTWTPFGEEDILDSLEQHRAAQHSVSNLTSDIREKLTAKGMENTCDTFGGKSC